MTCRKCSIQARLLGKIISNRLLLSINSPLSLVSTAVIRLIALRSCDSSTKTHRPTLKLGSHCGDDRYRPYFIVGDEFGENAKVCRPTQKDGRWTQKWWAMSIKKFWYSSPWFVAHLVDLSIMSEKIKDLTKDTHDGLIV